MSTFVIGDIHGAHAALVQCLERSGFNHDHDVLICLGDVADGWPETKQCVDELMKVQNLKYLMGNHDVWTLEWMETGIGDEIWLRQGGEATVRSYQESVPDNHVRFFNEALPYYLLGDKLFVHAGIDPFTPLTHQSTQVFFWDRRLAFMALDHYSRSETKKLTAYDEVYIGHTPIPYSCPIRSGDVWMMDTGAGWSGVLSIMNIETKEYWTSDPVPTLYPGIEGRRKL